jgi:membrane-associated phospholipid phosphatase
MSTVNLSATCSIIWSFARYASTRFLYLVCPIAAFLVYEFYLRGDAYITSNRVYPADFTCDYPYVRTWCTDSGTYDESISIRLANLVEGDEGWVSLHSNRLMDYARDSHRINFIAVPSLVFLYILFGPLREDGAVPEKKSAPTSIDCCTQCINSCTQRLYRKIDKRRVVQIVRLVFVASLALTLSQIAKHTGNRLRPCYHFGLENQTEAVREGNIDFNVNDKWVSFFSGDTTAVWSALVSLFLISDILQAPFAQNGLTNVIRVAVGISVVVLTVIGSTFRIMALMHWCSDVLTAIAVVFGCAFLERVLFCTLFPKPTV